MQSKLKVKTQQSLEKEGGSGGTTIYQAEVDTSGIAAVLLRNGLKAPEIASHLGISEAEVAKAANHCLSKDVLIAAAVESMLLRLAMGYYSVQTIGAGTRNGATDVKVWHRPNLEALKLLAAVVDHKRFGEALGQEVKPDKLVNLGIQINLGEGSSKAKDVSVAQIMPANKVDKLPE